MPAVWRTVNCKLQVLERGAAMDKKQKKRLDVLNQRIQGLRQQLAGARKQMDDPAEIQNLQEQLEAAEVELAKAKEGQ